MHIECAHLFSVWLSQILDECKYSSLKLLVNKAVITKWPSEILYSSSRFKNITDTLLKK